MKYVKGLYPAVALLMVTCLIGGTVAADPPGIRPGFSALSTHSAADGEGQAEAGPSNVKASGVLVGRLVSEKGFPVAWALVSLAPRGGDDLEAKSYSFVSGRDGTFMAGSIRPGRYQVKVSHAGYKPAKPFFIRIDANQKVTVDVVLQEQRVESSSIIVIAGRAPERPHPLQQTMTARVLAGHPGALEDPLRALARKPGVETRNDFGGRLSVRGSDRRDSGNAIRLWTELIRLTTTWNRRWEPAALLPLQLRLAVAYQPYEYVLRVDGDDNDSMTSTCSGNTLIHRQQP